MGKRKTRRTKAGRLAIRRYWRIVSRKKTKVILRRGRGKVGVISKVPRIPRQLVRIRFRYIVTFLFPKSDLEHASRAVTLRRIYTHDKPQFFSLNAFRSVC